MANARHADRLGKHGSFCSGNCVRNLPDLCLSRTMWSLNLGMMQARCSVAAAFYNHWFWTGPLFWCSCLHGIAKPDYTETAIILDFVVFSRLFISWFAAFSVQFAKNRGVDAPIEWVQFWEVVPKVSVKNKQKRRRHHLQGSCCFWQCSWFLLAWIIISFFRHIFFFASYAHRYWFTYHQAHVSFVRSEFVGSINTPIWGWYEATRIAHHLCRSILCLQYFCLAGDATVMAGLCSHQGVKKDDKSREAWNIWTGRAMFLEWWSPVGEIILQTYFPENADSFAQLQPFYQQKCKWLADEPMARSMKTVRTHMSRVKTVSKMWSAHQNGSALYVRPPK